VHDLVEFVEICTEAKARHLPYAMHRRCILDFILTLHCSQLDLGDETPLNEISPPVTSNYSNIENLHGWFPLCLMSY
jgi:hypothetical protein